MVLADNKFWKKHTMSHFLPKNCVFQLKKKAVVVDVRLPSRQT
jgi:hypothetical protein